MKAGLFFSNESRVPHLSIRYDTLPKAAPVPEFIPIDDLRSGDMAQTHLFNSGDGFYTCFWNFMLGVIPDFGASVYWPKAGHDLDRLHAIRGAFVAWSIGIPEIDRNGMITGVLSADEMCQLARRFRDKLKADRGSSDWLDKLLEYLGAPKGSWKVQYDLHLKWKGQCKA
ncbi:MAG TPA: hypothetical protein VMF06_18785 [Candidatus Limnocylindria bacterium]|nr:hypothetical protein [Candidatus Limnocylindria bacterium]